MKAIIKSECDQQPLDDLMYTCQQDRSGCYGIWRITEETKGRSREKGVQSLLQQLGHKMMIPAITMGMVEVIELVRFCVYLSVGPM